MNAMKKRKIAFLSLAIALLLSACATNKTAVAEGASVDGYRYVILDSTWDCPASPLPMDLQAKIVGALNSTRLTRLTESQIEELPLEQKAQALQASIAATQTRKEAIVRVDFTDCTTGELVAFCRGVNNIGLTLEQDMQAAAKRAAERIKALF